MGKWCLRNTGKGPIPRVVLHLGVSGGCWAAVYIFRKVSDEKQEGGQEGQGCRQWSLLRSLSSAVVTFEALAHFSFLTTGHRPQMAADGSKTAMYETLKMALDTADLLSHGLHAVVVRSSTGLLSLVHTELFAWHVAKKVDSWYLASYSPVRAWFLPNVIDTVTYCTSALLALRGHETRWYAFSGAGIYALLRAVDCVY